MLNAHAANGYLVHQFLSNNTTRRTDRYGGSIGNRIRFAVEVAAAVANEIGAERTGLRISPATSTTTLPSPTHPICIRLSCAPSIRWASSISTSSTPATTHSWTRFATCGRPH